ncbi:MAG: choice-of-anchor J domain-containing protein [Bacteroidales bacterium]|nr:choice-of-anchor J domain-containing protein [Bacteroidales bacterium]
MKKLFIITTAMLIGAIAIAQNKTTTPVCEKNTAKSSKAIWAEVENYFNVTDINGNTHDLAAYLDAGKTVIVDLSAVWCGYCWDLHQSGVFDDLHNNYGPAGSDELVVLWIDTDNASSDELHGIGPSTYGDWTVNDTWPVPIIQSSTLANSFSELLGSGIPQVFMVCPSGYYKDVTNQTWTSAASVYAQLGSCPVSGVVPTAEILGPSTLPVNTDGTFQYSGVSADPITGYAWTFEGGNPSVSTQQTQIVSWDTPGEYEITLIATNETGDSPTATTTVTIVECPAITSFPWTEGFEGATFPPTCWIMLDQDGDTHNWNQFSTANGTAHTGNYSAMSASYDNSVGALHPNNYLITPQISIPTNGAVLTYYVAAQDPNYAQEHYEIMVSTTGTNATDFTSIFEETLPAGSSAWNLKTVPLSSYANQNIHVAFVHNESTDVFSMKIDDVTIDGIVNIESVNSNTFSVFPNPATDLITVSNAKNTNITLLNMLGEVITTIENANTNQTIDISNLPVGNYIIKVNQEVFKINVSR